MIIENSSVNMQIRRITPLEIQQIVFDTVTGWSQNTVPIASTQVAIKGIVQYSTVRSRGSNTRSRAVSD